MLQFLQSSDRATLTLEQTTVGVNPWVVHRDTAIFGEDVESFRPDRWLKKDSGDMGMALSLHCFHGWSISDLFTLQNGSFSLLDRGLECALEGVSNCSLCFQWLLAYMLVDLSWMEMSKVSI